MAQKCSVEVSNWIGEKTYSSVASHFDPTILGGRGPQMHDLSFAEASTLARKIVENGWAQVAWVLQEGTEVTLWKSLPTQVVLDASRFARTLKEAT